MPQRGVELLDAVPAARPLARRGAAVACAGAIVGCGSLFASSLGIGASSAFGWKKALGTLAGAALCLAGAALLGGFPRTAAAAQAEEPPRTRGFASTPLRSGCGRDPRGPDREKRQALDW